MKAVAILCIVLAFTAAVTNAARVEADADTDAEVDVTADASAVEAVIAEAEATKAEIAQTAEQLQALSAENEAEAETEGEAEAETEAVTETETQVEAEAEAEAATEAATETEAETEGANDAVEAARECRDSMPTDQTWETGRDFIDRSACVRCAKLAGKQLCGGMWNPVKVACDAMAAGAESWDLAFAWGGLKELKLENLKACPKGFKLEEEPKMEAVHEKEWAEWMPQAHDLAKKWAAAKARKAQREAMAQKIKDMKKQMSLLKF